MDKPLPTPTNYAEHFNKAYPLYFHNVCEDYPHIIQAMQRWVDAPYIKAMVNVEEEELRGRVVRSVTALHCCLSEQGFNYVLSTMAEIAVVATDNILQMGATFCSFSSEESFKEFFNTNIFRRLLLHYAPSDPKAGRADLEKILGLTEDQYGSLDALFPDRKGENLAVVTH